MGTPNTGANTPESAPQKVSAIPGLGKKIMTALAALGIAASVEKVEGAVLLTTLPANQITTNNSASQTIEGITTTTIHIPYAPNGGTFTVGLNWQIDGKLLGLADVGDTTVDLGYVLQRIYNNGTPVVLVDTTGMPARKRVFDGVTQNSYDSSGFIDNNTHITDSWSIGPVTNPSGLDVPLTYKQIIDSEYVESQGNFGNASPGSLTQGIAVNFTPNTIPEPNTPMLLGAAGTLALLRRNRKKEKST